MYALVENNNVIRIIDNPINVQLLNGDFVTDIRLLEVDKRKELGIYDYFVSNNPESYQRVISSSYKIDNKNAIVFLEYVLEDIGLEDNKKTLIDEVKKTANDLLRCCDYLVIEAFELNKAVDTNLKDYRNKVRQALSKAITDINAITSRIDLVNFKVNWPDKID